VVFSARVPIDPATGTAPEAAAAAGLAAAAVVPATIGTLYVCLDSQLLHRHQLPVLAAGCAVNCLVLLGVFVLGRAVFRRHGVRWRLLIAAVVVLAGLTWAVPKGAAYAFPDPMARYDRELGGPGHCLHSTPHGIDHGFPSASHVVPDDGRPGRMTVQPLDTALPTLTLDHAARGGVHHLTPADGRSRAVLASYGC
jgi:hypothetical protein